MTAAEFPSYDAPRAVRDRLGSGVDARAIEQAVVALLHALGEDPARPGLVDTPGRCARAWAEFTAGMREDPARALERTFPAEGAGDQIIVQRRIAFYSLCEHHLVPFHGQAAIAYLPSTSEPRLVGLSKLARLVRGYAARLQVQERLTALVADALVTKLDAQGVAVLIEAEHLCLGMRGVRAPGSLTTTSALRGCFRDDARARAEVMGLLRGAP